MGRLISLPANVSELGRPSHEADTSSAIRGEFIYPVRRL